MTNIKYKENKLGRYRKGVNPLPRLTYFPIEAKFNGNCCMCHKGYKQGETVMFNPNALPGEKVAHTGCYLDRNKRKRT